MAQQGGDGGLCLRYPDNLGLHSNITHEMAVNMLMRSIQLAQQTAFQWSYIDKPNDGQIFLIYVGHGMGIPIDGLRYMDNEQKAIFPVLGRELEVCEIKYGFQPQIDNIAYRVRRRFRLIKGGHPQLVLLHYSRGPSIAIMPSLNQPVRSYPLRPTPGDAVWVLAGVKAGHGAPGSTAGGIPPGADGRPPMPQATLGGMGGMPLNMGVGMGGNPQAMLAQQNNAMEALERRSHRERERNMNAAAAAARQAQRQEEDDSADEADMISTRTLALTRYRRNHEYMNEVFMYAAFGNLKETTPPKSPYSIFNKEELEAKALKLQAEIEALQAKDAARREAKAASEGIADVSMDTSFHGVETLTAV
ncbi:hypothetical protein C8Q75DRAFT_783256 [Abortiporus biennis]|nr:hypothetical protein C8Q75DRAFT_783256 [Abortiporus biennis]